VRTDAEWRYWGKRDPLWSVASAPGKEIGGTEPWTTEGFLALGEADFADVRRHWEHYGMHFGRCVEIGCGAGRMTYQLARAFDTVLALDVSPDQIDRARAALGPLSATVDFHVVTEPVIPTGDQSCDAMFSCHVLQHLPGRRAVSAYLRDTARVLRKDGTVCFHLPVPGAHVTSRQSPLWYMASNTLTRLRRAIGIMPVAEYHRYRPRDVLALLAEVGFGDLQLRIFAMSSNGDYHSYFFGRKR
jgi:ubiquinone/menaquinone biosynthesis C-methylase UbiE